MSVFRKLYPLPVDNVNSFLKGQWLMFYPLESKTKRGEEKNRDRENIENILSKSTVIKGSLVKYLTLYTKN